MPVKPTVFLGSEEDGEVEVDSLSGVEELLEFSSRLPCLSAV
jgi:hypothetical protein